ncbi:MAG TPA: protein translocase subunit SecF [Ktedonobacteraceae bacterium]|nr:protein translocase subunit SecF [Ktedonobacteraceae bacterium]
MFNLVKYRYVFLIISLVVIVPGFISFLLYGLNVGIDFAGGSQVEIRPQQSVTAAQVTNWLKPLKLEDLQIVPGDDKTLAANKSVWVRLNTQIDTNVQSSIQNTIKGKYPETTVTFTTIPLSGNKTFTQVLIVGFKNAPKVSDIQNLLNKLPNTSDPTKGAPSDTAVTAPTPTVVPTASATAQPTAKATGTPVATPTPATNNNPSTIPVKVDQILQGTTTQTVTINTRTIVKITGGTVDVPKIQATILNSGGSLVQLISNSEVGPSVASDTTRNAILAVIAASAFILLYIWFSFRKIPKAWRYGACAIIAMLHDVLVVLGIFSILGKLFDIRIDALFITALLTVVGFSVHDTIVVFDRIRENLHRRTSETFEEVVNASLVQTMARSLNTSLTVLFTLSALTLFGGDSVRTFTLTLLIGIFSGTYSSIFNASMLLVIWEKGELGLGRFSNDRYERGGERRFTEKRERELARSRG